jgi:hypothetical protein
MHKVPFKRAVVGRTKTYDELRAEWRATRAAAQEAKEKAEKEEKEEEETVSNLVLVKAEPGLEVETAPQTAQPTEDSPNSHDDAYPTFHTPDANTDLAARRPDDEIAWLSAHATHLRAETSALTNQLRDFHRQAQARVMEILWLQREKSALQRAVADLATSAPGAADQLQSQPSLQNTGENPQGSVLTQDGQKVSRASTPKLTLVATSALPLGSRAEHRRRAECALHLGTQGRSPPPSTAVSQHPHRVLPARD